MNLKPLFFCLLILSLISCKKEAEEDNSELILIDTATEVVDSAVIEDDTLRKEKLIVTELLELKRNVIEKLKTAFKADANKLYDSYEKSTSKKVGDLNQIEPILEDFAIYFDQKKDEYVFPEPLNRRVQLIKKSDLEFWEVGEGYAEIRFKPYHYYNLFKGKVTDDYDYFIKNEAKENTVLFSADAGLVVPFKEVADRILIWENFINKYPESPLLSRATKKYQEYVYVYLFGLDNTPTVEWGPDHPREIYAESREEFNRFMSQNPKSTSIKYIKAFLEKFESGATYEELNAFAKKELKINTDNY